MAEHGESGKPRNIAQILHTDAATARKKASGNRFHLDYWKQCVAKVGESYSVQIYFKKKRVRFPLLTGDKDDAARRALAIFRDIERDGWEAALEEHKPEANPKANAVFPSTVGGLIAAAVSLSSRAASPR